MEVLNVDAVSEQVHLGFSVDAGIWIEHSDDDSVNAPCDQTQSAGNLSFAPLEAWLQRCEYGAISNGPSVSFFLEQRIRRDLYGPGLLLGGPRRGIHHSC